MSIRPDRWSLMFHMWVGDNTIHDKDGEFCGYERTPASQAIVDDYRRKGTTAWYEFTKWMEHRRPNPPPQECPTCGHVETLT